MDSEERREKVTLDRLIDTGERGCRCAGVSSGELDDCVSEFATAHRDLLAPDSPGCALAWLNRCAANFGRNFRRGEKRRNAIIADRPNDGAEDDELPEESLASEDPGPEEEIIRGEFQRVFVAAAESFSPERRELFRRYFLNGETAAEIAARTGQTPDAVRHAVGRLKLQLRRELARAGYSEAALRADAASFHGARQWE
ncbi:MAG TPA: sigma-70 family RNA polymerase sigma factor [Armatimonadota bacterium]|nr:sigma-70 family RNA polymerase sigma factor [Armatimonadota bacterium]